jgi:hypothetical protein
VNEAGDQELVQLLVGGRVVVGHGLQTFQPFSAISIIRRSQVRIRQGASLLGLYTLQCSCQNLICIAIVFTREK